MWVRPLDGRTQAFVARELWAGIHVSAEGRQSLAEEGPASDATSEPARGSAEVHIVIGVLSAVAGLIWAMVALQRSGLDLNALNPFLWHRRSQWKKKYGENPYSMQNIY